MERHGFGQMNENGERLANFCPFNKLMAPYSNIKETTKPQGYHQIKQLRTRRIIYVLIKSLTEDEENQTERSTQRLRYNTRLLKDIRMLEEYNFTVKNKY